MIIHSSSCVYDEETIDEYLFDDTEHYRQTLYYYYRLDRNFESVKIRQWLDDNKIPYVIGWTKIEKILNPGKHYKYSNKCYLKILYKKDFLICKLRWL
jgi:hypothetical protein